MAIKLKTKIATIALAKRVLGAISVITGHATALNKKETAHHMQIYSQEGEDAVLSRLIGNKKPGFYIDIGAHHPQRFSNTYLFYLRGWKGINIEPRPGSIQKFNQMRPRDINIAIGISTNKGELTYFEFDEPALNTFDENVAKSISTSKLLKSSKIEVATLRSVLEEYLPVGQEIDFMSIDVEGLDEQVLRSNNWLKFRPKFVLIESRWTESVEAVAKTSLHEFMHQINYSLTSKCVNTLIYKSINWT